MLKIDLLPVIVCESSSKVYYFSIIYKREEMERHEFELVMEVEACRRNRIEG